MNYKVVIPSAGLGSRIGPYSKFLNKALVTIGDKPAIAKVIEKFPIEIEIIILIGYEVFNRTFLAFLSKLFTIQSLIKAILRCNT